jgi:hypothetical protein
MTTYIGQQPGVVREEPVAGTKPADPAAFDVFGDGAGDWQPERCPGELAARQKRA